MSEKPKKVHQMSGTAHAFSDPKRSTGCTTCEGTGWVDGGAKACAECNDPPGCLCVKSIPVQAGRFCKGCGQRIKVDLGDGALGEARRVVEEGGRGRGV